MPHTLIGHISESGGSVAATQVGCTSSVLVHITRVVAHSPRCHIVSQYILIIGILKKEESNDEK